MLFFTPPFSFRSFNPGTGHYTQFVWSTARTVGCGLTTFMSGGWVKKLLVCNYGPNGNFIGSPMYKTGKACSACPAGTACSSRNPGLCSKFDFGGEGLRLEM